MRKIQQLENFEVMKEEESCIQVCILTSTSYSEQLL